VIFKAAFCFISSRGSQAHADLRQTKANNSPNTKETKQKQNDGFSKKMLLTSKVLQPSFFS
jgi:hypothetical protein